MPPALKLVERREAKIFSIEPVSRRGECNAARDGEVPNNPDGSASTMVSAARAMFSKFDDECVHSGGRLPRAIQASLA